MDNTIRIAPPTRPKKITGTRFAAVLGKSPWATPFEAWCELTGYYKRPFTGGKYAAAGQAIESKQIEYMQDKYGRFAILTPGERYGGEMKYDFFEDDVFGGKWDALLVNPADQMDVRAVIECKTTHRRQDWVDVAAPESYALQAALYARLLGVDEVGMVVTWMEMSDYGEPEAKEIRAENTEERWFHPSVYLPNLDEMIDEARDWYERHVLTGESPAWDEKRDAKILAAIGR